MALTQINVRLDEEQKEEWEEAIEESRRFTTLSGLVRAAVEAELIGEHDVQSQESPGLESDIQQLRQDVDTIRKNVEWLRKQQQEDVDISDTAQEVFERLKPLPDIPLSEVGGETKTDRQQNAASICISEYGPQTTQAIANDLDVSHRRVEDALEYLDEQFLPVVEVTLENQPHYFKEE